MKTITLTILLFFIQFTLFSQVKPVRKTTVPVTQKQTQVSDTVKKSLNPVRKLPVARPSGKINPQNLQKVKPAAQTQTQTQEETNETTEPAEQPVSEPVVTLVTGTITDSRDGNIYSWVEIGTQVWMSKNMAWLPSVTPANAGSVSSPFYYVYDFRSADTEAAKATGNCQKYGVLYNWSAALTACPAGWHLPTDSEWKQLELFLGMPSDVIETPNWRGKPVGGILKSATGWNDAGNGNGGTNESGFSASPGGLWTMHNGGTFYHLGIMGFYWTATEIPPQSATDKPMHAWYRSFSNALKDVNYYVNPKDFAKSVRCVKN